MKHLLFIPLVIGILFLGIAYAGGNDSIPPAAEKIYVVQPGDTLWAIAAANYPGRDPREVVWEIKKLNGIRDAGKLQIGQEIRLP